MVMPSDSSDSLLSPGVWARTGGTTEQREKPKRPSFSSSITSDRLRESERWSSTQSTTKAKSFGSGSGASSLIGGRRSVFKEIGLEDTENSESASLSALRSSTPSPANVAGNDKKTNGKAREEVEQKSWYSKLAKPSRPIIKSAASAPPATFSTFSRVAILAFFIAIVIPGINYRGTGELHANVPADGVGAGPIGVAEAMENTMVFEKRADSPIEICTRWAHQSKSHQ
jgi:hypothetical protein